MRCPKCQAEVNVLDSVCRACGKSLSLLDDNMPQRPESFLDRVSMEIDSELKEAERQLFENSSTKRPKMPGSIGTIDLGRLQHPERHDLLTGLGADLETSFEDIRQIASFVFYSPPVQTNPLYRQRTAQTSLIYDSTNSIVNAFATDRPLEGVEKGPPFIVIFGGMAHATRLAGLGLGYDQWANSPEARQHFLNLIKAIGSQIVKTGGKFNIEDSQAICSAFGLEQHSSPGEAMRKARSFAAAMNLAVISHELGHICLGHTLGKRQNYEVSRNQEREADSFAASVASDSPFGDYIVAGGIFWWVILCWVAKAAGKRLETTHPHPEDRLFDYIRANREQALSLGIDDESIKEFLAFDNLSHSKKNLRVSHGL